VPRELEGTLAIIGVIGLQLASHSDTAIAKALPFYGPRRLIEAGLTDEAALLGPILLTAAYGVVLLIVARMLISRRVFVRKHEPCDSQERQGSL
jgi:hypothetical protein